MSKTGKLLYKCRKCGKIDDSLTTCFEYAEECLCKMIATGMADVKTNNGYSISAVNWHKCKDGGIGITDIIGVGLSDE